MTSLPRGTCDFTPRASAPINPAHQGPPARLFISPASAPPASPAHKPPALEALQILPGHTPAPARPLLRAPRALAHTLNACAWNRTRHGVSLSPTEDGGLLRGEMCVPFLTTPSAHVPIVCSRSADSPPYDTLTVHLRGPAACAAVAGRARGGRSVWGLVARSRVGSPKGTLPAEPRAHLPCHRAPPSRSAQSSSCRKEGHWWGRGGQKGKRPISSRLHFPTMQGGQGDTVTDPGSAAHRRGSRGEFSGKPPSWLRGIQSSLQLWRETQETFSGGWREGKHHHPPTPSLFYRRST